MLKDFLCTKVTGLLLRELGYHSSPVKSIKTATSTLILAAVFSLIFETAYAILSIVALLRYCSPTDIVIDINLLFWGIVGLLRYLIILFNSVFKYKSTQKARSSGSGDFSTVGNAVYRKKYKPYIASLVFTLLIYLLYWIPASNGMVTYNTHNVWILPLVICFSLYFVFTAILNDMEVILSLRGYKPAVYNITLRKQMEEAFE
jgi:hypothetical protein